MSVCGYSRNAIGMVAPSGARRSSGTDTVPQHGIGGDVLAAGREHRLTAGAAPAAAGTTPAPATSGEGENDEHAQGRPHGGFLSRRWTSCRREHRSGTLQDSGNRLQKRPQRA